MKNTPKTEVSQSPVKISPLRRYLELALCVVLFAIVIAFAAGTYRFFEIHANSMSPTLIEGDRILVHAKADPLRGQIVALHHPSDEIHWLCKRIVALPGDQVRVDLAGKLWINGKEAGQAFEPPRKLWPQDLPWQFQMEKDQYYVLGDNRHRSLDSRDFGPVHRSRLIGVALAIYWPWARMGWLNVAPPQTSPEAVAK